MHCTGVFGFLLLVTGIVMIFTILHVVGDSPDIANQCTVFCLSDTTLYFKLAKVKVSDNFKYG